jgi:hypothetical protein
MTENTSTDQAATNGNGEPAGPTIDEVANRLQAAAEEAVASLFPEGMASVSVLRPGDLKAAREAMGELSAIPSQTACGCIAFTVERSEPLPRGACRIEITAHFDPDTDPRIVGSEMRLAHAEALSKLTYLVLDAERPDDEDDDEPTQEDTEDANGNG